ncbi:lysophospholipid acyltransferase family protein [Ancylobacter defluvii]|uniref:1-acyl-sn-glycerol-3-phosphate acyltransferase n=1 Tax=Ancylobacter defluvii TaxID=1282440 RepID=A0A9W6JVK7_9HYPH|nr:lysophospholipid acyltransferase family protein [Ancylobacter defluvii]MBS7590437.1 1-acyl-sn-glycerol-3-phosphate acyltransferase [Ancylobacter defluvii]GLK83358.1 1-acyl-sn-glycerol-3-phosphate acyltransferase [Ancylobacter defluvii]
MRPVLVLVPVLIATLIGIPCQWVAVRFTLDARRWIPVLYHRFVLAMLGVKVRVIGAPAADRPLMILSNHVSWLDIAVLGAQFPLGFIAKSEVAGWPGIGLLARLQRTIFVDRQARAATGRVSAEIADRLDGGDPVVLFAEGTSSDGNRVLPFRSALVGAARPSAEGRPATLQPLAIAYVAQGGVPLGRARRPLVAWYGDMDLAPHLMEVLRRGGIEVELRFGAPIAGTDRKTATSHAEAAVRAMMAEALNPRPA